MKIRSAKAVFLLGLMICCLFIFGCVNQTALIFPGSPLDTSFVLGKAGISQEVSFKTSDSVTISGVLRKTDTTEPLIVYFHGNGGNLQSWQYEIPHLNVLSKNVLMIDYRGYGKSGGKVTKEGLYLDGEAAIRFANANGFPDSSIILYGRSIGAGIAAHMLRSHKTIKGIILETPFKTFEEFIYKEFWFVLPWFYLSYDFDNCSAIKEYQGKVLILHGTEDQVIPYKYGKSLKACNDQRTTLVTIPGGHHNDLGRFYQKFQALQAFRQDLQIIPTKL